MNTTLITGASSGIGAAFARKLARRGRNVLLVARSEDKLVALCNELGRLSGIDVNVKSLVELTNRFLVPMRERRQGVIINVASTAAFQAVPFMATYAATKAFVLSFSEALREENRPWGIHVLALCPGVTDTNFFEAANIERPPMRTVHTAEEVVDAALRGVKRRKSTVIAGWANWLTVEAERFVPRSFVTKVAAKALRSHLNSGSGGRE
jgi:short-subunit dehydrogenase